MIKKYLDLKQIVEGNIFIWKASNLCISSPASSINESQGGNANYLNSFIDYSTDLGINPINSSSNPIGILIKSSNNIISDKYYISSPQNTIFYENRFYYLMCYRTLLSSLVVTITMEFLLKIDLNDVMLQNLKDGDFLTICCRFSSSVNNFSPNVVFTQSALEFGNGFGFFVVFSKNSYRILSFSATGELSESNPVIVNSSITSIKTLFSNGIKFKSILNGPTSYYGKDKTLLNGNRFFMCSISPSFNVDNSLAVSVTNNCTLDIKIFGKFHKRLYWI
jgi:hypothetical protein